MSPLDVCLNTLGGPRAGDREYLSVRLRYMRLAPLHSGLIALTKLDALWVMDDAPEVG